jgi:F-type H+-transporting ATPase subunit b
MLLSLDGTLVVQLVNFVIFLAILNAIFLRPVGAAIAKRRAYIDGVAADIERFEAERKTLAAEADAARRAARSAADAVIAQARSAAQAEAAVIMADHQAQASAIIAEAQATVGLELASARLTERDVVETLARTMLERAVGPELAAR